MDLRELHEYREGGDITTTHDMRVYSELDRFHQAIDAVRILRKNQVVDEAVAVAFIDVTNRSLEEYFEVTRDGGVDIPKFTEWKWKTLKA
ncbi:hypothetical protein [Lactococcus fujiensis]|uniref:Xylulose 5-phosphate/Fructose 6-phosphate phosphoketolase C-terminal domain-containing protein n=1 Tax=Lactococcus fujiensis JCM 16395 TaxID=1291764 RepID=A0A2A5RHY5_9LACT|nr:hypothetical protein [Lactococcus fujiensis]PCR98665.1 hypothetical protein RT41_GL001382 [Lactococcus fujiensis JCM 16395]